MHTYTLILNIYEFIDKTPEKLRGKNEQKTGKNRSKCVSFFVDGISGSTGRREKAKNGEKTGTVFGIIIFFAVIKHGNSHTASSKTDKARKKPHESVFRFPYTGNLKTYEKPQQKVRCS